MTVTDSDRMEMDADVEHKLYVASRLADAVRRASNAGIDSPRSREQVAELCADVLRLYGVAVPDAPTNADKRPGDNCVACRKTDAGLDELSIKCCNGGLLADDIPCGCASGDKYRGDPVMTMPVKPREGQ